MHVHVYMVGPYMTELDIDTTDPVVAKQQALLLAQNMALNDPRAKRPDCKLIAIIPHEPSLK